ncbi:MAG: HEPN domain-containing protein [Terriglobia bacterium]
MERGKHRAEWRKLSNTRIEDGEVLLRNGRYDAAYYLAGYAVECALKARIVRLLEGYFPPKQNLYIHSLEELLKAAELAEVLGDRARNDRSFARQWNTVKQWSEHSRYDTQDQKAAEDMLKAVRGVVECIKEYW